MKKVNCRFYFMLFAGILLGCLATGCSDRVSVKGTIVFSDTGEPLPCGEIVFSNDHYSASGRIHSDGKYTLGSYCENDGILPGDYIITIVAQDMGATQGVTEISTESSPTASKGWASSWLIDPKYGRKDTSGLSATIDRSTKNLDFEVDRIK